MVALMIIKNNSNFILFFQITADSISPSGLFNTDFFKSRGEYLAPKVKSEFMRFGIGTKNIPVGQI